MDRQLQEHVPKNIEHIVRQRLMIDARLVNTNIEVSLQQRHVVLRGKVHSLLQKLAAEETARRTDGVRHVQNLIAVEYASREIDGHIQASLQQRFESSPLFAGCDIAVAVESRVVLLSGAVTTAEQKMRAEALAGVTPHAVLVRNHISIAAKSGA